MIFYRIVDDIVYSAGETDALGFSETDPSYIPDVYLVNQEFVVMRTCFGLGDWGIISAMPRLLKEKYPNCIVNVPSPKLLEKIFGSPQDWLGWGNPYSNVHTIFDNNPYIDNFVDKMAGDIFHDHYRIFDKDNLDVPLVEQMLKFWQFSSEEYKDSQPEIYWSDEEKELGNKIITEHCDGRFGSLLISDRYDHTDDEWISRILKNEPLPYFYWSAVPIKETSFNFIDKALDMRHVNPRIQLYIRSKAVFNVGNQCGVLDILPRYNQTFTSQRQASLGGNNVNDMVYHWNSFKQDTLRGLPDKHESKTTTSLKFKADLIDEFRDEEYKSILEIGSSNGSTTRVLSALFDEVTSVDILPERHEASKKLNDDRNNINYILRDVYGQPWDIFGNPDVVFIDCVHTAEHIRSDINNALSLTPKLLIFDDYGLFSSLKGVIDEFVENGKLEIVKKIGRHKGTYYPTTQNKILKDQEGVICKVV